MEDEGGKVLNSDDFQLSGDPENFAGFRQIEPQVVAVS
jgi:hypothetical protein